MSTRSGTLRAPGRALPTRRLTLLVTLLVAAIVAAALWASLGGEGSDATTPFGPGTQVTEVERATPGREPAPASRTGGELDRAKQLGVEVVPASALPAVAEAGGDAIVVGGEVCQVCWKYR